MTQIMAYYCYCLNYSKMNICSFVIRYYSFATVNVTFNFLKKISLKIGSKTGKNWKISESLTPTDICVIQFEFNENV